MGKMNIVSPKKGNSQDCVVEEIVDLLAEIQEKSPLCAEERIPDEVCDLYDDVGEAVAAAMDRGELWEHIGNSFIGR